MAATKVIDINPTTGLLQQRAVQQTSAGAGDAGKVVGLSDAGYLDETLFPNGEVIDSSAGAGDAGTVIKANADGRVDETFFPNGDIVDASTGAGDAGKVIMTGADGLIDVSLMPVGVGADTLTIQASENLSAGDLVNVYSNAGAARVRKADATTSGKEANGYVLSSVTSGNNATVYVEQKITGLSGLTDGSRYYLATTAGGITTTPPSSSGNVVQFVGRAASDTELIFQPGDPVVLA